MGIQAQPCCCPGGSPVEDACEHCNGGVPYTFTVSMGRTSDLNRSCSDCNDHFDSIDEIPVTYQGEDTFFGDTYHYWRSAEDVIDTTDCSGVFDDHVITVMIKSNGPTFCTIYIAFHHKDDAPDISVASATNYYGQWSDTAVSTLCTGDYDLYSSSSKDTSLNCHTLGFADIMTLHL